MRALFALMTVGMAAMALAQTSAERRQHLEVSRSRNDVLNARMNDAISARFRAAEQRIKDTHKALNVDRMKEWKKQNKAEYDALMAWQRSGKDADRDKLFAIMIRKLEIVGNGGEQK